MRLVTNQPRSGRCEIVVEDAVLTCAEGDTSKICDTRTRHQQRNLRPPLVELRGKTLLRQRQLDSGWIHFKAVIEHPPNTSIRQQLDDLLLHRLDSASVTEPRILAMIMELLSSTQLLEPMLTAPHRL